MVLKAVGTLTSKTAPRLKKTLIESIESTVGLVEVTHLCHSRRVCAKTIKLSRTVTARHSLPASDAPFMARHPEWIKEEEAQRQALEAQGWHLARPPKPL